MAVPAKLFRFQFRLFAVALVFAISAIPMAHGQNNNNNNNNNTNNNSPVAGIDIDPDGVLRVRQSDPRLALMQRQAAIQKRGAKQIKSSPMRKVSLQRLEKAVQSRLSSGETLSVPEATLAGMTRVEYVIYLPGSQDIVLAGPAEETHESPDGRIVGLFSGHPTVRLDDIVVALRAFGPDAEKTDFISCSIDPTAEGLARFQNYFRSLGGSISPNSDPRRIAMGMKESLGLQTVSIHGIPASTRFAATLVEADYRMKLIGIGLESPAIPIKSWVARANPGSGSTNSMQRWYFTADYSQVKTSPDAYVLKLEGRGVKLVGEDERVDRAGNRTKSDKPADPASRGFTSEFTEKFERLADMTPVFYEMRNLFDISVCAAYLQAQNLYAEAQWDLGCFKDESRLKVEISQTPRQVETAVNAIWRGSRLMTPIGGGIHISAKKLARLDPASADSQLAQTQLQASAPENLAADQWWWD
jgi:hypothetical protein